MRFAGVGLGWRPETAWLIDSRPRLGFTEVIAESVDPRRPPPALAAAIERGLTVITHGVGLSLGGADPLDRGRVRWLAEVSQVLRSPLVSEHVAFCRARGVESAHFLPVPHTRAQLAILVDNVRRVQDALDVPFALENVAAPVRWPGDELAEAELLAELLDRTGAQLLLDVSNLYANLLNFGGDLAHYLSYLPLDRIGYLHVGGGARVETMWRDTHAHAIDASILGVLGHVLARTGPRPLLLERDHHFGNRAALEAELAALENVLAATPPNAPAAGPPPPPLELPGVTRVLRRELGARQHELIVAATEAAGAPVRGIDPVELAEARAIIAGKAAWIADRRARRHS